MPREGRGGEAHKGKESQRSEVIRTGGDVTGAVLHEIVTWMRMNRDG